MSSATSCTVCGHMGATHCHLQMIFQCRHEVESRENWGKQHTSWVKRERSPVSVKDMKGNMETKRKDEARGWTTMENKKLHTNFLLLWERKVRELRVSSGTLSWWFKLSLDSSEMVLAIEGGGAGWQRLKQLLYTNTEKSCNKPTKNSASQAFCLLHTSACHESQATWQF